MINRLLEQAVRAVPWRMRRAVGRLPLLGAAQRWLLTTVLGGREFIHVVDAGPARGLRYPVVLPEDKGVWTGTYEMPFAQAVADAVTPGDICFDLGGWRGFFSGIMALAGARKVYVFEASPSNSPRILRLMALNPSLPIELVALAIGETPGLADFELMPHTSMGKLAASSFQPDCRGNRRVQVEVATLDGLLSIGRIELPQVVKMDIEGAELLALKGARQLLHEARPHLLMEIHSPELLEACRSLLGSYGYSVTHVGVEGTQSRGVCHVAATAPGTGRVQ